MGEFERCVYATFNQFTFFKLTAPFHLALKRVMETEGMELEIIINPKATDDGQQVIQVRYGSISFPPKWKPRTHSIHHPLHPFVSTARNRCRCSYQTFQERTWN